MEMLASLGWYNQVREIPENRRCLNSHMKLSHHPWYARSASCSWSQHPPSWERIRQELCVVRVQLKSRCSGLQIKRVDQCWSPNNPRSPHIQGVPIFNSRYISLTVSLPKCAQ